MSLVRDKMVFSVYRQEKIVDINLSALVCRFLPLLPCCELIVITVTFFILREVKTLPSSCIWQLGMFPSCVIVCIVSLRSFCQSAV